MTKKQWKFYLAKTQYAASHAEDSGYGKYSKILNPSCLSKRPKQTVDPDQTDSEGAI